MKSKYKLAFVESIPYIIVLIVIGLALYLNALIVQDTITQLQAESIGYGLLTGIIGAEVFSLYFIKVLDIEKRQLELDVKDRDKKIEEFALELNRLKKES